MMLQLFHWFTLGALAMMLGYILFQYIYIRRKEYLYFSLYLFFTILSFFIIIQFYQKSNETEYLLYHASYSTIPILSFISFLFFMEHLLDIKSKLPFLSKTLRVLALLLAFILVADAVCYLLIDEIMLHFTLSNLSRLMILVVGLIGSILLISKVGKEGWFFLAGTIILVIAGSVTTYKNSMSPSPDFDSDNLLQTGMFYYRMGTVLQILLFSVGISYKSKQIEKRKSELEIELMREKFESEIEKQKAIEKTRTTIAGDLHDDIGATLSSINIFSKLASDKIKQSTGASEPLLEKIRETSQEMMNNMSDVIWSIQPDQDTAEQFAFRIKSLMQEFFEPTNIHYRFENLIGTDCKLPMEVRRNLYLIIKEALNNAAKYSHATDVQVNLRSDTEFVHFSVTDNGTGFEQGNNSSGNGIKNMNSRIQNLGGLLQIESDTGKGTRISGKFPIDKINY